MDNNVPSPEFTVGIQVLNMSVIPHVITEILRMTYVKKYAQVEAPDGTTGQALGGWYYVTSSEICFIHERYLKKSPDGNGMSWEQLKDNLNIDSPINRKETT